ncbi:MAG: hypothetical protein ACHQ49_04835 [Elusimicrobiota bacterium]
MKSFAAAALLLASACALLTEELAVRASPQQYSPAMSSSPGIGLTPVFTPPAGTTARYRWTTNFGGFVSWNPPDYKVVPRGSDPTGSEGTLYWTYDPRLALLGKPVVSIVVEAIDPESGRVLARSKIKLDWDSDVARVRD